VEFFTPVDYDYAKVSGFIPTTGTVGTKYNKEITLLFDMSQEGSVSIDISESADIYSSTLYERYPATSLIEGGERHVLNLPKGETEIVIIWNNPYCDGENMGNSFQNPEMWAMYD